MYGSWVQHHDIIELLLKVALNTIKHQTNILGTIYISVSVACTLYLPQIIGEIVQFDVDITYRVRVLYSKSSLNRPSFRLFFVFGIERYSVYIQV
jgi:hypothetical protein